MYEAKKNKKKPTSLTYTIIQQSFPMQSMEQKKDTEKKVKVKIEQLYLLFYFFYY